MEAAPGSSPRDKDRGNRDRDLAKFSQATNNSGSQPPDAKITTAANWQQAKSGTILIVDDTPDNLLVLFSYLEEQGFKVLLAEDGETALKIAQSKAPDLILLDVLMPEMDGFETCRRLKAQPATREIPVIFLTALSETVNKVQGFKLGGVDYITKPSEQEEVLVRIQTHLNLRKMRQTLAVQNKELSDFKYALDQSAIVAIADVQGTITYVNDQFCNTSQYEREELIDQTHRMINSGYHVPEFFQDLWSTIASGQIWRGEIKNQAKDGSYYWLDTTIVPFLDEKRKPWQYLAISHDTTERKQIDREVREFATQLQQSNRELENFAYIISHDLQEPLRKMKSFSQLLAREYQDQLTDNEKAHRYLDYIIDAAGRQQTMIQALLNYSRLGSNDSTKVAIDLGAVVEKVLEDLSIPIAETQATVTVGELPTVRAYPIQMAQLFLNLIGNGIKFRGPAAPRIQIEAQLQLSEWLISVRDNGIGIKPQYAERIFQIFQRLHSRSEYSGTGIGLAICQKIVEDHGGRIWVASESDQGSTFYLTLPVMSV